MTSHESVLGVQGCVGLVFHRLHSKSALFSRPAGCCVGCVGLSCAQARAHEFHPAITTTKNSHANSKKACTPYTPCTFIINSLFLLGFKCVGCVLGWPLSVLGSKLKGVGHEC